MANFGKRIDLQEAAPMYDSVMEIRTRTHDKIKEALKGDAEAQRYYLGRETVFFFDRDLIDHMLELIGPDTTETGKGVAVYAGSKLDDVKKVNGRPIIMVFAYNTIVEDGREKLVLIDHGSSMPEKSAALLPPPPPGSGQQHPGGGGGGGGTPPPPLVGGQQQGMPTSFWVDEIQP